MVYNIFNMINLYKTIKKLREEKKISQEEISKKIGVSRSSYINFEKGEKELTLSEFQELAKILDVNIGDFLDSEKNIEKYKQMLFVILRAMGGKKIVKTKLAKLLYLADFAWYYNTHESMSGMRYRKMTHGPVPNDFFSILGELEERGLVKKTHGDIAEFYQESEAGKNIKENFINLEEKKMIKKIVKKWKDKNVKEIVDFTHNQLPYLFADSWEEIPYELIIQEDPKNVY